MEQLMMVLARGIYATMLYNREQIRWMARKSDEDVAILEMTEDAIASYERIFGFKFEPGTQAVPKPEKEQVRMPGIADLVREGALPVNTSEDSGDIIIGAAGTIELTENDEVIDIVTGNNDNVIPLHNK